MFDLFSFLLFMFFFFEWCRDGLCWAQGVAGQLEGARAWGSRGAALGQLNVPFGVVAMSTGGVWVADRKNHRLCLLH